MSEDMKVEVTKLGEKYMCKFDDKIAIELNPYTIERIARIFKEKALTTTNYGQQGSDRAICDLFEHAHYVWEEKRSEKDE